MKDRIKKYGKYLWRLFFVCILLSITCLRVKGIEIPVNSSSEIPYWDFILRMAGRTGIVNVSKSSYIVSFGYCLPFAMLVRSGISLLTAYKSSILVNGVLWMGLYLVSAMLLEREKLWKLSMAKRELILSFLCILPIFFTQALLMGPQIALGLLTLLLVWYTSRKDIFSTVRDGVGFCLLGWLGMFLSPLFAGVLLGIILYFICEKKGERHRILQFAAVFIVGLLLMEVLEYGLLLCMQTSKNEWNYTGLHSLFIMVAKGRRTKGMLGLIYGAIGKGMYLIVHTFGLILVGTYSLWKNRKQGFNLMCVFVLFHCYFLFVAEGRTDSGCGLPMDTMMVIIILPVLMKAVDGLISGEINVKVTAVMTGLILVVGCLSRDIWELKEMATVDWSSAGIISLGRDFCRDVFEISILATATVSIIFLLICITVQYKKLSEQYVQGKILWLYTNFFQMVMYGILVLLVACGVKCHIQDILPYAQDKIAFSYNVPGDYLELTERSLQYYVGEEEDYNIALFRLLSAENQEVSYVTSLNTVSALKEDRILITKELVEIPDQIAENYNRIYSTDQMVLWEHKNWKNKDSLQSAMIGQMVKLAKVNSSDYENEEYGKNYIQVKGKYVVKVNIDINTSKKGKLGKIAIKSGSDSVITRNITGTGKRGEQTISLFFESEEDLMNFKVTVQKKSSVYLDVTSVCIKKLGDADEKED